MDGRMDGMWAFEEVEWDTEMGWGWCSRWLLTLIQ